MWWAGAVEERKGEGYCGLSLGFKIGVEESRLCGSTMVVVWS